MVVRFGFEANLEKYFLVLRNPRDFPVLLDEGAPAVGTTGANLLEQGGG
jgi:hypothetical protein